MDWVLGGTGASSGQPWHCRYLCYRPEPMDVRQFFDKLGAIATVRVMKLYRLQLEAPPPVPILPCLDHEAMLHEEVAPHAAAYVEDSSGGLHELVYIPDEHCIQVDTVSTMFERSPEQHEQFVRDLATRFPACTVKIGGRSWLKGDLRVSKACRAQVPLRDVLTNPDLDRTKIAVDRLRTISSLMEKESRVASWASRTLMTPLLAAVGFVSYQALGLFASQIGEGWVAGLRYTILGVIGAYFLYYGLRAVHLTQMANRVWKRSAEYGLILTERQRLADGAKRSGD